MKVFMFMVSIAMWIVCQAETHTAQNTLTAEEKMARRRAASAKRVAMSGGWVERTPSGKVIRIVNAGRHPVHFNGFIVKNGYPTAINLGTYSYPADGKRLVAPGETITVDTIVVTEHDDVTFPESAEIWCETTAQKLIYVQRVEFTDDCPASEAKKLSTIAQLDIPMPAERIGCTKGYK